MQFRQKITRIKFSIRRRTDEYKKSFLRVCVRVVLRKPQVKKIPGKENITERCVYCSADTGIPVAAPIKQRKYYIIGGGQLCPECYGKMKFAHNAEDNLSEENLQLLLKMSVYSNTKNKKV